METSPNQNAIPSATQQQQENLFGDVLDTKPYEKNLKTARIYLYIVAALQVGVGIYQYANTYDKELALFNGAIPAGLGVMFLLLAIWSYKKPAMAFMTALIVFVVAHLLTMFDDPSTIIKGIILKILVVLALIKGFNDAREVEKLRESMGVNE